MTGTSHDRAAAWLVLAGAGTTTMSFNIWHAFHARMPGYLALLDGIAPVVLAMGMSHIVARRGWFLKIATGLVMAGAMVLSARATGYGVRPAAGNLWWLFAVVTDAAVLVAFQVIVTPAAKAAPEAIAGTTGSAIPEAAEEPREMPPERPAGVPSQEPRQRPSRVSKEPDAESARADYRKSVRQGQPLSDRALGDKYGRSRTWGAARIRETEAGPRLAGTGT
jgi:hypothetical protein